MGQYIGIEIGKTLIKSCLIDTQGNVLKEHKQVTVLTESFSEKANENGDSVRYLIKKIKHLIEAYRVKHAVKGIWIISQDDTFIFTDDKGASIKQEIGRVDSLFYLSLANYVVWHLTGQVKSHVTVAAQSPYFDVNRLKWSRKGLKKKGLDHLKFPPLTVEILPVGQYEGIDIFIPLNHLQIKCFTMVESLTDQTDQAVVIFDETGGLAARLSTSNQIETEANRGQLNEDREVKLYDVFPYFDNHWLIASKKPMTHQNFNWLIDRINQVGSSFFQSHISEKEAYAIMDEVIQKELFSQPHYPQPHLPLLEVSMAHLDIKKGTQYGKIEGLTYDNSHLGQFFKQMCDDTLHYMISALEECLMIDSIPVSVSGRAFEWIHYLNVQMKGRIQSECQMISHHDLAMRGILKLARRYELDL